ncbi:hypothetical protein KC901_02800 [Patescibacteria group bacterium]|nr:hypothetical protein [Patescibacteria group bacterium]
MERELLITEVSQLLTMMGISVKEIRVIVDTDLHLTIMSLRMSGTEEELFTDNHGEVSRSLGYILKELLQKKHHFYKDIVIDINGKDKEFIDFTKEKASIAVERVQFFDKPYEFGYLNAYERMLIHTYLKNTPGLETVSEGEGKDRRLTVKKQNT